MSKALKLQRWPHLWQMRIQLFKSGTKKPVEYIASGQLGKVDFRDLSFVTSKYCLWRWGIYFSAQCSLA